MAGGRLAWGLGVAKQPTEEPAPEPVKLIDGVPLVPHPSTPAPCVRALTISAIRMAPDRIGIFYAVDANETALSIPSKAIASRSDGLWHTTCFEVFARLENQQAYLEFNLSPSTKWAAYRFADYRDGMRTIAPGEKPAIVYERGVKGHELWAEIDLSKLPGDIYEAPLCLGVSAVIEDAAGAKSFWALRHPQGKPDFHHRDCFSLKLSPPREA